MDKVLYKASPSMFQNQPIAFNVTCILCLVVVGIPILLMWWLRCKGTVLTITESKTILLKGILSKFTNEVYHSDVRNVRVSQSFFQRLFSVGHLEISSAGQSGMEIEIDEISRPNHAKKIVTTQQQGYEMAVCGIG